MSQQHPSDPAELAQELLAYLDEHPDAADTFEGLVDWWLVRTRYLRGMAQVQAALDLLVDAGLVIETVNQDGTKVYRSANKPRP